MMNARTAIFLMCVFVSGSALILSSAVQEYLPDLPVDHPAIQYFEQEADDPVARLDKRLRSGDIQLGDPDEAFGYLPELMRHLNVNSDSQALVFSKTSFQASRISPDNPRAVYFGDNVALAFIRGVEHIEAIGIDPQQGAIFYTASIRNMREDGFTRQKVCLSCHLGPATSGVPGIFIGSVYPGPTGLPFSVDAIITDHRTKFEERWGGWYVNAKRGQQKDRSNAVASNPAEPMLLDPDRRQNLPHLFGKIRPEGYLSPVSDIVALMTFEHQTQMTNYITRVGWEERILRHNEREDQMAELRLDATINALVDYMLFVGEQPLPAPLEGISTFTATFPERGPRDSQGRSLRDFGLQRHIFRYPLSYMIYSESFDAIPDRVRNTILRRLHDVLTGKNQDAKYARLTPEIRSTILDILRETKENLPDYWKS